ncbi:Signal transduction histidine kinase [Jatrophihabitans endophyticus]|uniref:histidine kinase n=1 Tax=Jatrophihabitans endophyticus TaxID=1206085 RepID=A0A1M5UE64_9ACTN|nr:histidine kinase [Jatrophihabitans endophyticus]SHH61249.1 Signal transduction histidine kinase [Jatrophihabitans endophyticus]
MATLSGRSQAPLGRVAGAVRPATTAWRAVRRRTAALPWLGDATAAAGYAVGCLIEAGSASPTADPYRALDVGGVLLVALGTAALALQRRSPAAALLATGAVAFALSSLGYVGEDPFGALGLSLPGAGAAVAMYALSLRRGRPRSVQALLAAIVVGAVPTLVLGRHNPATELATLALAMVVAWSFGDAQRTRHAYTASLRDRAERLERERHVLAEAAVAQERARIARELHDVVAHHLSLMIVNAAAADRQLTRTPAVAHALLTELVGTGQAAVTEMRRLLTVLRSEGEGGEPWQDRHPQPTFAGLDELVQTFRSAGLQVELARRGTPRPLAAGVDLTAYRIVQESLTNALRHAGAGARVQVDVAFGDDALELRIRDDGAGARTAVPPGGVGHGLIGMQERINLVRGELAVGADGAGFAVRAVLPLAGARA